MISSYPKNLTSRQAEQALQQNGENVLPETSSISLLSIFARQFKGPFIYVLLAAAVLSFILGQKINAFFILVVLIINAVIGTIQEFSAEKAATALKKMVPSYASVIRDNKPIKIITERVVPGDLVQLVPGDKIPADLILVNNNGLQIDESMLTGESISASKSIKVELNNGLVVDNAMIDKTQRCFAGTVVMSGRGFGYVNATGANTEIGQIAADVENTQSKPPLLLRIERFTLRITYGILILISLIFIITVMPVSYTHLTLPTTPYV